MIVEGEHAASSRERLVALITGDFSRPFFIKRLVPAMTGFLLACLITAGLLFPRAPDGAPGYIPFTRTISGQGNHSDNPAGAWFFLIGLVGASVLLVPFNAFAWRRLSAVCTRTAGIALFFALAGAAGFAMVGIWDEQTTCLISSGVGTCGLRSSHIHNVGSAMAFGGNLFALIFNMFPMIANRLRTKKDEFGALWQVAHVVSFVAFFVISTLVTSASGIPDLLRRYAFWQWTLFILLVAYTLSFALRLPAAIPEKKR